MINLYLCTILSVEVNKKELEIVEKNLFGGYMTCG